MRSPFLIGILTVATLALLGPSSALAGWGPFVETDREAFSACAMSFHPKLIAAVKTVPINENSYTASRPLRDEHGNNSYAALLHQDFLPRVEGLLPHEVFLDDGAGEFHAIFDIVRERIEKGLAALTTIGIDSKIPKKFKYLNALFQLESPDFKPLLGVKTEAVTAEQVPTESVTVATSVYGGTGYSERQDLVVFNLLRMLKIGGELYSYVESAERSTMFSMFGSAKYKTFGFGIEHGSKTFSFNWLLAQATGIALAINPENAMATKITKIAREFSLPELELIPEKVKKDSPPLHIYRLTGRRMHWRDGVIDYTQDNSLQ